MAGGAPAPVDVFDEVREYEPALRFYYGVDAATVCDTWTEGQWVQHRAWLDDYFLKGGVMRGA